MVAARFLAACPNARALAISREQLGVAGERLLQVASLDLPPRGAMPNGPRDTPRSGCSSNGREPSNPVSRSPRAQWAASCGWAAGSTGCRRLAADTGEQGRAAGLLGVTDRVRGITDTVTPDAVAMRVRLLSELGEERFTRDYGEGHAFDTAATVAGIGTWIAGWNAAPDR
ncbi:hypothetical protein [Nocardiopsis ansamitocini]|uniref:Uncharacterized protein n=1 Tax=Nocardiopsis ansamitocini TaxID=1670832 RepID=A0A9W6UJP6_9ACTN|nr:hypothetical protein [Nocardiopsis ansamitocini]GLU49054.1 hypothetical protein Nans01_34050 [Nocardiopsis ansamitocini]